MLNGTHLNSDVIKSHRCLVHMKDALLIDESSPGTYKSRYEKGDRTKIGVPEHNNSPVNTWS